MNTLPLAHILVVDDETALMQALCNTLRDQGYETTGFSNGAEALAALQDKSFDLLLTDLMMPSMDGVELLSRALKIDPQLVGILMTGMGTIQTAVQAMQAGALDYILKPFKVSAIQPVLARAIGVRRLRMENLELRNTVAIHELNQAIAHTLDPNVLLDKIVDAAMAQFEADEASVMLLSSDESTLYVAAIRGQGREALLGTRVPAGRGIAWEVVNRREPLVVQGDAGQAQLSPLHPRPEIQSSLSMPMVTRSKLIGVLNVNCVRQRRAFTFGQIKVLGIFTNAAAAGIQAARIHAEERRTDARYREVLQMAADGIISMDEASRIVVFNRGAEQIFGYAADEALGKPLEMLIPAEFAASHHRHVESFAREEGASRTMAAWRRLHGRHKDGRLIDVEVGISKRAEGRKALFTAVVRDITLRVQQEDHIARLTRLYAVLSGVNSTIVRSTNEQDLFAQICRIAVELGGFRSAWIGSFDERTREMVPAAVAGDGIGEARFAVGSPDPDGQDCVSRALQEGRIAWENDLQAVPPPGHLRASVPDARAGAAIPFSLQGKVRALMLLYSDTVGVFGDEEISLLRDLAGDVSFALDHLDKTRKVDYLATHDTLTGLANRALFLDRLEQIMAAARRTGDSLAVVMVDIERFRHVNESFGRQAGDDMLRQLAARFEGVIQERASLARIGGDVFALIYSLYSHIPAIDELARVISRRVEEIMAEPFTLGGRALNLAARVGVAFFPSDGDNAEAVFKNAEAALKRAKAQHTSVVFYTPDLNARVAEQLLTESKLRRALERNEFVLHYQPKVDAGSGRITGLEALLRWMDPESGLVPPFRFIPVLEETGLIMQVGRWAMQEAVRAVERLRSLGLPAVRIAVNVSPIQLRDRDFVATVRDAIAAAGAVPHGLDLEITESVIMDDIDANVVKLGELRDLGVELSIDDFGTGYSSLAYMARLPVSVIKIDRAFVNDLESSADSRAIVQAIISLTHSLNRKVVAEGVETGGQLDILRFLVCDQCQGYLFSKPVELDAIVRLLGLPAPPWGRMPEDARG